jgi:hypothetical protein
MTPGFRRSRQERERATEPKPMTSSSGAQSVRPTREPRTEDEVPQNCHGVGQHFTPEGKDLVRRVMASTGSIISIRRINSGYPVSSPRRLSWRQRLRLHSSVEDS